MCCVCACNQPLSKKKIKKKNTKKALTIKNKRNSKFLLNFLRGHKWKKRTAHKLVVASKSSLSDGTEQVFLRDYRKNSFTLCFCLLLHSMSLMWIDNVHRQFLRKIRPCHTSFVHIFIFTYSCRISTLVMLAIISNVSKIIRSGYLFIYNASITQNTVLR